MNILLLGSGREHAFAWKWFKVHFATLFYGSRNVERLIATNVAIAVTDFEAIKALVIEKHRNGCCWARRPIGQRNLRFS
jgi:phosphoribosylamine--glycine ligase